MLVSATATPYRPSGARITSDNADFSLFSSHAPLLIGIEQFLRFSYSPSVGSLVVAVADEVVEFPPVHHLLQEALLRPPRGQLAQRLLDRLHHHPEGRNRKDHQFVAELLELSDRDVLCLAELSHVRQEGRLDLL